MARVLELDDTSGPFQPKLSCDSVNIINFSVWVSVSIRVLLMNYEKWRTGWTHHRHQKSMLKACAWGNLSPSPPFLSPVRANSSGASSALSHSSHRSCSDPLFLSHLSHFADIYEMSVSSDTSHWCVLSLYITEKSLWLMPCSFNGLSVASSLILWALIFYLNPISVSEAFCAFEI